MKRWLLAVILLWPSVASAWTQAKSSVGAPIHWDDVCQTYYINYKGTPDVPGDKEFAAVRLSFKTWNDVECSAMDMEFAGLTDMTTTGYFDEKEPINLVIWRDDIWPYDERPVAFTNLTYDKDTGVLYDADIELNGVDYIFTVDPIHHPDRIDVQNCVTHEAGHVFGLDHSSVLGATMYAMAQPGEFSKRTLHQDDIEGICTLYPADQYAECPEVTRKDLFFGDQEEQSGSSGCSLAGSAGSQRELWDLVVLALLVVIALVALKIKKA